jgi:hypothetical protein
LGVEGAVTFAGIAAIVAICVISAIQLWQLGRFQEELRRQGFVILDDSQAICTQGCHLPARPAAGDIQLPRFGPSEADLDILREWMKGQQGQPSPGPTPAPSPGQTETPQRTAPEATRKEQPAPQPAPAPKEYPPEKICDDATYDRLKADYESKCKDTGRMTCSKAKLGRRQYSLLTCDEAKRRLALHRECLAAREEFERVRFASVDPRHEQVLEAHRQGIRTCEQVVLEKCRESGAAGEPHE